MVNGVLNVYKPRFVSSNNVVIRIKKLLNIKKVGHTGTLDPLACGVLPICIGSGTKLSEYFLNKDKTYFVKLKFGVLTTTLDSEGEILKEDKNLSLNQEDVIKCLESFVCEYNQTPPIYSALKVNGKRAYDLARQGVEFTLNSRKVTIHSIYNIEFKEDVVSFYVKCSKGTYIRSLCKDIGEKLNTYGMMLFLERVESGIFKKEDALDFETLTYNNICDNLIPLDKCLDFKKLNINDNKFLSLLVNGVEIKNPMYIKDIEEGIYFFYDDDNLIGVCERKHHFLKSIKILN